MWTADKLYYQGQSGFTKAYQGSTLVWEMNIGPSPTATTKEYFWTGSYSSASNAVFFKLPTQYNNKYKLQIDFYTTEDYSGDIGGIIRMSNNFPLEFVLYNNGFYLDSHYPNSTANTTVNTTDYDSRIIKSNVTAATISYSCDVTHTMRKKYFTLPHNKKLIAQCALDSLKITTGEDVTFSVYAGRGCKSEPTTISVTKKSGSVLLSEGSLITKNFCTSKKYTMFVSCAAKYVNRCYVGDIRVLNNNDTIIHNFQLYPYNGGYAYWDTVEQKWYTKENTNNTITNVTTKNR